MRALAFDIVFALTQLALLALMSVMVTMEVLK